MALNYNRKDETMANKRIKPEFTNKQATLIQVVETLIGPTDATGHHSEDVERLERINELGSLTLGLLETLVGLTKFKNQHEQSIQDIGQLAYNWCKLLQEEYLDDLFAEDEK